MNLEITFRHMEHTESIDAKIREKMGKFGEHHLSSAANLNWTGWVEHHEHYANLHVKDHGHEFFVKAQSDNMYKTIDKVVTKLEAQLSHIGHHPGH